MEAIGGIRLGDSVVVTLGPKRYREMYGGAVTVAIIAFGQRRELHLDPSGARELAADLLAETVRSEQEYLQCEAAGGAL